MKYRAESNFQILPTNKLIRGITEHDESLFSQTEHSKYYRKLGIGPTYLKPIYSRTHSFDALFKGQTLA